MTKLQKLEREYQKTKEKIAELQETLVQIDKQKIEQENLQIIQTVRSLKLSPDKLHEFLSKSTFTETNPYTNESEIKPNEE